MRFLTCWDQHWWLCVPLDDTTLPYTPARRSFFSHLQGCLTNDYRLAELRFKYWTCNRNSAQHRIFHYSWFKLNSHNKCLEVCSWWSLQLAFGIKSIFIPFPFSLSTVIRLNREKTLLNIYAQVSSWKKYRQGQCSRLLSSNSRFTRFCAAETSNVQDWQQWQGERLHLQHVSYIAN